MITVILRKIHVFGDGVGDLGSGDRGFGDLDRGGDLGGGVNFIYANGKTMKVLLGKKDFLHIAFLCTDEQNELL